MTSLVSIDIESIYKVSGKFVSLPRRMAKCTPDTRDAILSLAEDVNSAGARFRVSDLFRDYDMQLSAHLDYKEGRKRAYSPPPGSSFHEAGRAFDVSLGDLKPLGSNYLEVFWEMAAKYGIRPIISEPNPRKSEAWHFECRGEFQRVRELRGYKAAVRAAILDIGVTVPNVRDEDAAWIQGQILAYGLDIGPIDGIIGKNTKQAIRQIKVEHNCPLLDPNDPLTYELPGEWLVQFLRTLKVSVK